MAGQYPAAGKDTPVHRVRRAKPMIKRIRVETKFWIKRIELDSISHSALSRCAVAVVFLIVAKKRGPAHQPPITLGQVSIYRNDGARYSPNTLRIASEISPSVAYTRTASIITGMRFPPFRAVASTLSIAAFA